MRRPLTILLLLAAAGARATAAAPASVVHLPLPGPSEESQPISMPTDPRDTLEVDLPWPLADWAGRGFTPDPERFAGDFVVEANRGAFHLFVTPVAADAHRVLHVVLAPPGQAERSVALEFVAAPPGLAWRKAVLEAPPAAAAPEALTLARRPPPERYRSASPASQRGMLTELRLAALDLHGDPAGLVSARTSLSFARFDAPPRSFGDFTLRTRFALRDATTGSLGLCVSVSNATRRRLLFDPQGWVVRAGEHVYPVSAVDFSHALDPGAQALAFLVASPGPQGDGRRLLPGNDLEPSARVSDAQDPRPVTRAAMPEFEPR